MANPRTIYDEGDKVNDTQRVVTSTWTNNVNDLVVSTNSTSSVQADFASATSSGAHYIDVYNIHTGSTSASSEVQFSVAYGHKAGSGSLDYTNDVGSKGNSPSKIIYNQYRQLVFGDETKNFQFPGDQNNIDAGTTFTPDDIYVINVNRSRYKNNLKAGSLNLTLCVTQSDILLADSTVGNKLTLTDDSVTATGSAQMTNAGRQFNLVSGSNGVTQGSSSINVGCSGSYGLFYPDAGFIILNPEALKHTLTGSAGNVSASITPGINANTADNNHQKLVNAISGGGSFIVDSEEKISSKYYFTRVRNNEYNFTTNPSFMDETGNLRYSTMENNPKVYITTVGLYNDTNDLIAVAKLSQPIAKDFSKEALIRVKLDY